MQIMDSVPILYINVNITIDTMLKFDTNADARCERTFRLQWLVDICFHFSLRHRRVKDEAIDFTSPRASSGQASQLYEMVPIGTISSPSKGGRKPQGDNHQALAVKGEWHPTCGLELESNPGRIGERRTCYHGATKGKGSDNFGIFFDGTGFWTNSGNVLLLRLDISIIRTTREELRGVIARERDPSSRRS